jgi:peptidoglycan hydrolase-like protein with peptidoglycan-binding domain
MARRFAALSLSILAACSRTDVTPEFPSETELAADTSEMGQLLSHLRRLRDPAPPAYDSLSTILLVSVQVHLGKMGFGAGPFTGILDPSTRDALKRFEAARGLPSTGNPFTKATLSRIMDETEQVERFERAPGPRRPVFAEDQWATGYLLVEGQWLIEPTPSAFDESVRIECWREDLTCDILYARMRAIAGRRKCAAEDPTWGPEG